MKIWYQSFTVLEDLPAYEDAIRKHVKKVVRPDTEVTIRGQMQGTYPTNYPGNDLIYSSLFMLHGMQWVMRALHAEKAGYDVFAMSTIPNPLLREIRTLVDIPVVGYGEASCHLACMLGRRFGVLCFIDKMSALLEEQIGTYGLSGRCVGVKPLTFPFQEVLEGYSNPGPVIDKFRADARRMIAAGADVIIPGEMPTSALLAREGVTRVDDVPLVDGIAATLNMAEMMVDLKQKAGVSHSRNGWFNAAPARERVNQLLDLYGLSSISDKIT